MKRLIIRLSILSVVAVLGFIAIAQARNIMQQTPDSSEPETVIPDAELPPTAPRPIKIGNSSSPSFQEASNNNPLRSSQSPQRKQFVPQSSTATYSNEAIPSASDVMAQQDRYANTTAHSSEVIPASGTMDIGHRYVKNVAGGHSVEQQMPQSAEPNHLVPEQASRLERTPSGQTPASNTAKFADSQRTPDGRSEQSVLVSDEHHGSPSGQSAPAANENYSSAGSPDVNISRYNAAATTVPQVRTAASRYPRNPSSATLNRDFDPPQTPVQSSASRSYPPQNGYAGEQQPPNTLQSNRSSAIGQNVPEGTGRAGGRHLEGAQSPTFSLEKIAPREIQVGKEATFEIKLRNVGKTTARSVEIHDVVPKGTTLVGTTPEADMGTNGQVVWKLGDVEAGAERKVQIRLMPVAEGEIGSVATVHFAADVSVRTVCTKPELTLRLTAPPKVMVGDSIKVAIEISNPGTGAATGVMLLENIPQQLAHPAGPSLEFEVGTLAPGESRELELVLNAKQAGLIANEMVAQADANLEARDAVNFEVVAPKLAVAIDGPKRRYLERPATYTVSVANPGTASAKNIELVSYLPKGMKFVRANNAGQYDPQTHSVIWGLEELPAKQSGSVQVVALPIEQGEQKLRIKGKANKGLSDETTQSVDVEGLAAILFGVADIQDPIEVGGNTSYEVHVVNQGSKAATNVSLVAILPPGMKAVSAEGPTRYSIESGRVIFSPLNRLAPKADTTYRIKVQATQAGDQRFRVQLVSGEITTPVVKEESTRVYSDE